MKVAITLFTIAFFQVLQAQVTTINDTMQLSYNPYFSDNIDSLIWIKSETRWTAPWQVYYDTAHLQIAYETIIHADTTEVKEYWRNGNIKYIVIYVLSNETYLWHYEEIHCENGQLVRKSFPNDLNEQLITNYHCNGNKKNEFLHSGTGCIGKMLWWYEDGTQQEEQFWENYKEEGEWKYFKTSGELDYIDYYRDGILINSTKQ